MKETESSLQLENERLRERLSYANKDGSSERDIGDRYLYKYCILCALFWFVVYTGKI